MRDEEDRDRERFPHFQQVFQDPLLERLLETGERFVQEQELGSRQERAAQRDPAPLAARKRGGAPVEEGGESENLDDTAFREGGSAGVVPWRPVAEIAEGGKMREKRVVLRDVSHRAAARRQVGSRPRVVEDAAREDDAPRFGAFEPGNGFEERRLARP